MNAHRQDDLRIAEQAAEWAGTLDSAGPQEQAQFVAWLRQSARHVEEFLLASAMYRELDGVDAGRRVDIEKLMAEAATNVVPLNGGPHLTPTLSPPKGRRGGKTMRRMVLAAAVAGIAAVAWLAFGSLGWQSYSTSVGEQRAIELSDGSLVHLNTRSQVKVRFSSAGRDIQLLAGEALFKVVRDPARPFRVRTDRTVIQALGTQFNVYRKAQETTVSVIEGSVRVSEKQEAVAAQGSAELTAGQEVRVIASGQISPPARADATKATAWRQRRLVFRNDRLADVAEEFNRYNRVPRIVVRDQTASERQLTGVFDADAPESLVRFLADAEELAVGREGDTVVIRGR